MNITDVISAAQDGWRCLCFECQLAIALYQGECASPQVIGEGQLALRAKGAARGHDLVRLLTGVVDDKRVVTLGYHGAIMLNYMALDQHRADPNYAVTVA